MFYKNKIPTTLHIEISTKCNAACPMCSRNNQGFGLNKNVTAKNLSLSEIMTHLGTEFISGLHRLIVCGNFGDPLLNPEIIQIFQYIKSVRPQIKIELHTNGGIGNTETWIQLAHLVDFCRFGIDGLEDTNHIYRRGVHWNSLMANVKKFIAAGGSAQWAFLVFKHNEHQLEAAEKLSNELGFNKFIPKRSNRHLRHDGSFTEKWPVYSSFNELEYYIEPATDLKFKENLEDFKSLTKTKISYENYLSSTPIYCKVKEESSVYLSAEGLVLPCCWLAIDYTLKESKENTMKALICDIDQHESILNFKTNSILNIVSGPIFNKIEESWSNIKRVQTCARICGAGFDPFKSQF